jgi:hypothetical protein
MPKVETIFVYPTVTYHQKLNHFPDFHEIQYRSSFKKTSPAGISFVKIGSMTYFASEWKYIYAGTFQISSAIWVTFGTAGVHIL